MSTIKNSESFPCFYTDNGCIEFSRLYHGKHEVGHKFPGVRGIPLESCVAYKTFIGLAILDESIDVSIRIWMEDVSLKDQLRPFPPKLLELFERKAAKMPEPSPLRLGVKDV